MTAGSLWTKIRILLTLTDSARHRTELAAFGEAYGEYTACKREIDKLSMDEAEKERLADSLRYRIEELENAQLKVGEEDELIARRDLLRNSEKLTEALERSIQCIVCMR